MKIEIRELTDTSMKFVIDNVDTSFVNTLRRVLLAEVPKIAIEDVEFHLGTIRDEAGREYESTTALFDEIIAHRLGLVPIPSDVGMLVPRDKCDCKGEGCPNCTIMYILNKCGPCMVYSGDLEPLGDPKFAIREKYIPIVKLDKNQAVLIYATAIVGTGKEHAKWQSAVAVGYRNYPKIKIYEDKCKGDGECVKICPKKILKLKNNKITFDDNNIEACILCNSCEEVCKKLLGGEGAKTAPAIRISAVDDKFIFQFETDGAFYAKNLLIEAFKVIIDKFNEFKQLVDNLKA